MKGFYHRNATSGIVITEVQEGEQAAASINESGEMSLTLPAISEQANSRLTALETGMATLSGTTLPAMDTATEQAMEAAEAAMDAADAAQETADKARAESAQAVASSTTAAQQAASAEAAAANAGVTAAAAKTAADEAAQAAADVRGTLDEMYASTIHYSQQDERSIQQHIESRMQYVLLWENETPTEAFAADRKIALNLGAYEAVLIQYHTSKTSFEVFSAMGALNDTVSLPAFSLTGNVVTGRTAGIAKSGVTFSGGKSGATASDDVAIPYRIYGVLGFAESNMVLQKLYVLKNGELTEPLADTWGMTENGTSMMLDQTNNRIVLTSAANKKAYGWCAAAIDLTGYKTFYARIETYGAANSGAIGFIQRIPEATETGTVPSVMTKYVQPTIAAKKAWNGYVSMDISGLSGEWYLGFYAQGGKASNKTYAGHVYVTEAYFVS